MDPITNHISSLPPAQTGDAPRRAELSRDDLPGDVIELGSYKSDLPDTGGEHAKFTILHTNDLHGRVNPYNQETNKEEWDSPRKVGGLAYLGSAVKEERKKNPEGTLLLDAGDISTGTPISDLSKTAPMIDVMNALEYDAMTVGNHEFDRGTQHLRELADSADFPFLSANLVDKTGGKYPIPAEPYIIKDINGVRVGILGLTYQNSLAILNMSDRKEVDLLSNVETAQQMIPRMKAEGAELIIAVTHQGVDADRRMAEKAPGIDVIIGGHSHTTIPQFEKVNDTLIVQTGAKMKNLGEMELDLVRDNGRVRINEAASRLIPINTKTCAPDSGIAAVIKPYNDKLEPYLQKTIGNSQVDLTFEEYYATKNETTMANFVTDTIREATGADFCIFTPSTFRHNIPAGEVKVEDIHLLYPWPDGISLVTMTGKAIHQIVEQGLRKDVLGLSPSGLRITYDMGKPSGERVIDITTQDGKPLEPDRMYTLVTKNFQLDASEQFPEYKNYEDRVNIKESVPEILITRFESGVPVTTQIDGRLHNIQTA